MFENTILYLMGFAGCGKYTVAKEIASRANFTVLHNHLTADPILSILPIDSQETRAYAWGQMRKIREIVFETMVQRVPPEKNFVLTNVLVQGVEVDEILYAKVQGMAQERGACFIPVRLLVDPAQHEKRITAEDRKQHHKLTDPQAIKQFEGKEVFIPPHPYLTINTTSLSPYETATLIMTYAEKKFKDADYEHVE